MTLLARASTTLRPPLIMSTTSSSHSLTGFRSSFARTSSPKRLRRLNLLLITVSVPLLNFPNTYLTTFPPPLLAVCPHTTTLPVSFCRCQFAAIYSCSLDFQVGNESERCKDLGKEQSLLLIQQSS